MITVNNSGAGNCMYYAYSISLMYCLRNRDDDARQKIFARLQLPEESKVVLTDLLNNSGMRQFTKQEDQIIEGILGAPCRNLAADNTKLDFIANPEGSEIYGPAVYQLSLCFYDQIKDPDFADITRNSDPDGNYTDAEILKVAGIKQRMQTFAKNNAHNVIIAFTDQWKTEPGLTPEQISFRKTNLFLDIVGASTLTFFAENDLAELDTYIDHLKVDFSFASEETLQSLNRAISGEKKVLYYVVDTGKVSKDGKKIYEKLLPVLDENAAYWVENERYCKLDGVEFPCKIYTEFDPEISIEILKDGVATGLNEEDIKKAGDVEKATAAKVETCDISLDNWRNGHWVSCVPFKFVTVSRAPSVEPIVEPIKIDLEPEVEPESKIVTPVNESPKSPPPVQSSNQGNAQIVAAKPPTHNWGSTIAGALLIAAAVVGLGLAFTGVGLLGLIAVAAVSVSVFVGYRIFNPRQSAEVANLNQVKTRVVDSHKKMEESLGKSVKQPRDEKELREVRSIDPLRSNKAEVLPVDEKKNEGGGIKP